MVNLETLETIKYKYDCGSYGIQDLRNFVKKQLLKEEDFFEITRLKYKIKKDPVTSKE